MSETPAHPWDDTTEPPATLPPDAAPATTDPGAEVVAPPSIEPPQEPPKAPKGDRRFAQVTARLAAEKDRADKAERELAAALEMARVKTGDPTTSVQSEGVEQAAARLIAQREFDARRDTLVRAGRQEFGEDAWNEKTGLLHSLGATSNQSFLQALVELPNATRVVSELADDPDALTELLTKSPAAMAAKLGRMDAAIEAKAAAAPPKPSSNAPRPPIPLTTTVIAPEPDPYDEKLSMAEYVALRRKTAPRHLGGQGKVA